MFCNSPAQVTMVMAKINPSWTRLWLCGGGPLKPAVGLTGAVTSAAKAGSQGQFFRSGKALPHPAMAEL